MSIERDDPEGRSHSADSESAETTSRAAQREKRLFAWAARVAGGLLLRRGFPEQAVESILNDAVQDYNNFKKNATKKRKKFFLDRVWVRAEQHAKLRGITLVFAADDSTPHLLDLVHTREAVELLPKDAQMAIRMLFFERKTHEEVAEALGVSLPYARRICSMAMARLKKWRRSREPQE